MSELPETGEDCAVFMGMYQWEKYSIGFCNQIMPLKGKSHTLRKTVLQASGPRRVSTVYPEESWDFVKLSD